MKRALAKVRSAPGRAWRGTARTAKWAGSGVAAGPRRAAGAIGGATRGAWERSGGAHVARRARSSRVPVIAWAVGAVLLVAWIGWAIYVTTEYGGAAGLGVLISWPAAIAALALVAAPFVGIYLLVQRNREPALAGPAGLTGADRPERNESAKDEGGSSGPDAHADRSDDEEEDEPDAEDDEDAGSNGEERADEGEPDNSAEGNSDEGSSDEEETA